MQRQSEKKHTDENAHEVDTEVFQKQPSPKTMPSIWEDMHRMQKDWSFLSGMHEEEDQNHE